MTSTKHSWKVVLTDPDAILRRTNFVEWCEWCGTLRHTRRYWSDTERADYWYDKPPECSAGGEGEQ